MSSNQNDLIKSDLPKLYDPGIYTVFGIFLGLETVLFMSWMNSIHLPNRDQHRSTVKKYALGFIAILLAQLAILGWATAESAKGVVSDLSTKSISESYYAVTTEDYSAVSNSQYKFAKTVSNNSSLIFFGINIALLIGFLIYTNKTEAVFFKESYSNKTIKGKIALLPLVLGIAYTVLIYFFSSTAILYIAKLFLK
ncbi:hypothetical protein IT412_03305 [Candidatus Peregrinibacteria bacterium]|nr:hypothetical protein [Candidatus Peregrinibacteria bacterium]